MPFSLICLVTFEMILISSKQEIFRTDFRYSAAQDLWDFNKNNLRDVSSSQCPNSFLCLPLKHTEPNATLLDGYLNTMNFKNISIVFDYNSESLSISDNDYCRVSWSMDGNTWNTIIDMDANITDKVMDKEVLLADETRNQGSLLLRLSLHGNNIQDNSDRCFFNNIRILADPITLSPTVSTSVPTIMPSIQPTRSPTVYPTINTRTPTVNPTNTPTYTPTINPTNTPTVSPTGTTTDIPTISPTNMPTTSPLATETPTINPTVTPTVVPTTNPTVAPTIMPTVNPTISSNIDITTTVQTINIRTSNNLSNSESQSNKAPFDMTHVPTIVFISLGIMLVACLSCLIIIFIALKKYKSMKKKATEPMSTIVLQNIRTDTIENEGNRTTKTSTINSNTDGNETICHIEDVLTPGGNIDIPVVITPIAEYTRQRETSVTNSEDMYQPGGENITPSDGEHNYFDTPGNTIE